MTEGERGLLWYASPERLRGLIQVEGDVGLAERSERPVMWLVPHFMAHLVPGKGVSPLHITDTQMDYLMQYAWPGNARELRNLIERSLILGALNVSALYSLGKDASAPATATAPGAAATDLQTLEKQHICTILDSVQGDKTRAAQLLGISRRTLERRCAEWALM